MTKAVLLDLGDVLVGLDFERGYRAAAAHWQLPVEMVRQRIRDARLADSYERGEISSEEFHSRFSAALGGNHVPYAEFADLWGDMFQERPLLSEELIAGLASRYPLVLLSNTNELHFHWILDRYPLLKYFKEFVLSYKVGSMKPAPAIFEAAISRAGCAAGECVFADDLENNVTGALSCGIDAVLFRGEHDLRENLRHRGLSWV